MKALIRDRQNNYKTIGIPAGSFVTIYQGATVEPILEKGINDSVYQSFTTHVEFPKCGFGSGVYFVKNNFNLICLESNYDSSD